jgi:hydroxyacylglutathione hydrolase
MSAIRQQGKLNDNTTLLDIGMRGIYGLAAVYLVRGEKTCLIDGGTRTEAPRIVKMLRALDAFPPDYLILTHPHWDHAQGVPRIRRAAPAQYKMEVLASQQAIPLLADPSFNDPFGKGPYERIQNVTPLNEGDTLDLGGLTLRMFDVPGHCQGHLAILDEQNGTLFTGDAAGVKMTDHTFLPPFMPPTWDPEAFLSSVNKLKHIPHESICLAHFGCIYGDEAASILDEVVEVSRRWWELYERNAGMLNDTDRLLQVVREEINPAVPDIRPTSTGMRLLFGLVVAADKVLGRKPAILDKLAFGDYLSWLVKGYQTYTTQNP